MPDCISKAAIICLVLSFTCHLCDAQERASGNTPKSEKPAQLPTPNPLSPGAATGSPGHTVALAESDPPAVQGRPGTPVPPRKTDEERRQAIDKRTREYAAEAVKDFQKLFPTERFPKEQFPLFFGPEIQRLLGDEDTDDKLRSLRKKRCRAAFVEYVARISEYQTGMIPLIKALESAQRLASSLLELEPDLKTRLLIFRHNLAVARALEQFAYMCVESGTGPHQDLAFATHQRTEAEIHLLQEEKEQQQRKKKVAD